MPSLTPRRLLARAPSCGSLVCPALVRPSCCPRFTLRPAAASASASVAPLAPLAGSLLMCLLLCVAHLTAGGGGPFQPYAALMSWSLVALLPSMSSCHRPSCLWGSSSPAASVADVLATTPGVFYKTHGRRVLKEGSSCGLGSLSGLSPAPAAAGKSTVAYTLEHALVSAGKNAFVLDGAPCRPIFVYSAPWT